MATILDKFKFAWRVGQWAFRTGRQPQAMQKKEAPFRWSGWQINQPQWRMRGDVGTYIAEGYETNALIYSAIIYKMRAILSAPLRAYTGDRDNPDRLPDNHELSRLLRRPNQHQGGREFMAQTIVYFNVAGDAFIWGDRAKKSKAGYPVALYALRPDRVRIIPKDNTVMGYWYVPEGRVFDDGVPLLPEDVAQPKMANPGDPFEGMGYGLSPLSASARAGDVDNIIGDYLNMLFQRGGYPPGILSTDQLLNPGDVEAIRERWRATYGGANNWDAPGVIDRGTSYQPLSPPFNELGFAQIDDRNESRILGPLGVPGILIGSRSGVDANVYGTARLQARAQFWEDTLIPELHIIADALNDMLVGDNDSVWVDFDLSETPALRKDIATLVQAAATMMSHGVPRKHAYATVGLNMPDFPDSEIVYMPSGMQPIADETEMFKDPSEPPAIPPALAPFAGVEEEDDQPPEDEPPGAEDGPPPGDDSKSRATAPDETAIETNEARAALWRKLDQIAQDHEDSFRKGAKAAFERDRRAVMAMINQRQTAARRKTQSVDWQVINTDLVAYFEELGESDENWRELFVPIIVALVGDRAAELETQLGVSFDVSNLEAEMWFTTYTLEFAQPINKTTKDALSGLFQQALEEGWSVDTAMNHTTQLFDQWMSGGQTAADFNWYADRLPDYRTEAIVRTETIRASNAGSVALYRGAGIQEKEWLATHDSRVRPEHLAADEQRQPIGSAFDVGGDKLDYPADPRGRPENTINCRCAVLPVINLDTLD